MDAASPHPGALRGRFVTLRPVTEADLPALLDYRRQAPGGVQAHPTDEHLLPLYVALGAGGEVSLDGGSPIEVASGTSTYTFPGVADGTHTITVTAYDRAGNELSESVTFRVDTGVLSPSGPYGVGPLLAIIVAVIVAAIAALLILLFIGSRLVKLQPSGEKRTIQETSEGAKPSERSKMYC